MRESSLRVVSSLPHSYPHLHVINISLLRIKFIINCIVFIIRPTCESHSSIPSFITKSPRKAHTYIQHNREVRCETHGSTHSPPYQVLTLIKYRNTTKGYNFESNSSITAPSSLPNSVEFNNATQGHLCESNSSQWTLSVLEVSFQRRITGSKRIMLHREWSFIPTSLTWRVLRVSVSWIPPNVCESSVDVEEFIADETPAVPISMRIVKYLAELSSEMW